MESFQRPDACTTIDGLRPLQNPYFFPKRDIVRAADQPRRTKLSLTTLILKLFFPQPALKSDIFISKKKSFCKEKIVRIRTFFDSMIWAPGPCNKQVQKGGKSLPPIQNLIPATSRGKPVSPLSFHLSHGRPSAILPDLVRPREKPYEPVRCPRPGGRRNRQPGESRPRDRGG